MTPEVSHALMFWLKAEAPRNIHSIVVTPKVSHAPMHRASGKTLASQQNLGGSGFRGGQSGSENYASQGRVAQYASYSPVKLDCCGRAGGVIPACYPELF